MDIAKKSSLIFLLRFFHSVYLGYNSDKFNCDRRGTEVPKVPPRQRGALSTVSLEKTNIALKKFVKSKIFPFNCRSIFG